MNKDNIKNIDLKDWLQVGEGGTAFTYSNVNDDGIILKLYKDGVDDEEAIKEYEMSKHIEELGFTIPKAIDIVKCDNRLGVIFEKIKSKLSFSRMIADDPMKIKYCATELAKYAKILSSTPAVPEYFNNKKDMMKEVLQKSIFEKDVKDALYKKLLSVPDENTCLHGDFQPGNFVDSCGTTYMIDLGNFGYGNHMFDIGSFYFACYVIITEEEKIDLFHMPLSDLRLLFDEFAKAYVGDDNSEKLKSFYKEASEYGALFMAFAFHILGYPKEKKEIYEDNIRRIFS